MMLHLMEKSLLEERVGQLDLLSNVLAQELSTQGSGSDEQSSLLVSQKLLELLSQRAHCDAWWIYNQNLQLIESSVVGEIAALPASTRQIVKMTGNVQQKIDFPVLINLFRHFDMSAQFVLPIKKGNNFSGLLELNFSLADIQLKRLESQKLILLYVFFYGAILVIAGYVLLQRNIIRPAQNLLKATQDVSLGNLGTRLPTAGPVEIAQLADSYNQMVEALLVSRGETEQTIQSLEKTNRELQQTRDELIRSEKMASVGQLAAGLAHELGNPLAAIIGYLELLKQRIQKETDKDIVERSLVEATRIDFLVRELLDFSRPAEKTKTELVDMIAVLNSTVQLLENQGLFSELKIINHLPDSLILITIDQNKLQQVFINLLLNAVQACALRGEVTLSAGDDGSSVWIGINDNGSGIAADDLNRIFDPFFTTKGPGEGVGLGLAMCQRIVEEAGGAIEVESVVDAGSFFRLRLY